ncbi:MAG: SRPBCC family protein, partial [Flavobacteriales bacterium]
MRALKIILILAVAMAALIGALGYFGSDHMRVERSIAIAAPVDEVWQHVATLSAQDRWSPWNERDPAMKKTIEGDDGAVGAVQRWEGNREVGKGELRITAVEPHRAVRMRLAFIEPFQNESDVGIELAPEGDGTRATWT